MVENRLNLEPEVCEIIYAIERGKNFLLSGGAGSGKTYSLVSFIKQIIQDFPTSTIACITYTNAAVKEIGERVNHKNIKVSTIHDFLWENIKNYQKELKVSLINLLNNDALSKFSIDEQTPISQNYFDDLSEGINYKEYLKLREGIISHDELLIVANYLFKEFPKLGRIVKDKYKFILIDEYQDTSNDVVEILLTHFKKSPNNCIIGFFGDSMQ